MRLWFVWLGCDGAKSDPAPVDCEGYDWDTVGAPFVYTWCTTCHAPSVQDRGGAPVGVDFDTYEGVLRFLSEVEQRAVIDQDMPPMGGPFEDDIADFSIWIDCGAP